MLCPGGLTARLTAADADLIQSCLGRAFHGATCSELNAQERIARNFFQHRDSSLEHSRVLLADGVPVGACLISHRYYYSHDRAYPYVDLIAVDPSLRRHGMGRALLRTSMRSLWEDGHRSVIHAHIRRGNLGSETLFRGCDFIFWRRDDD